MQNKTFTKRDTGCAKGAAVILMVAHHLFTSTELCVEYSVCNFLFPFSFTQRVGEMGKVCVPMFVFLTGFGTSKSLDRYEDFGKQEYVSFTLQRYLRLELNFLCIYLLVIMSSFLGRDIWSAYQPANEISVGGGRAVYACIDALGMQSLFNTPTLNPTWWYMALAFFYIFITPVLVKLYERYGVGICFLLLLFPYALHMQAVPILRYMGELGLGIWCAKENIIEKVKSWSPGKI